jgi:DNA-binding MarR family transcriptional regulator
MYIQLMSKAARPRPEDRVAAECHCLPLRMVHRIVTGVYDAALRPHDLRVAQMNVLVAIAKMGDEATPARVSRYLLIEKSTLSRDLERMQERGWIAADPEGAGRKLRLTADGRRLLERVLPAWEAAQKETEALLGKSATDALRATAARVRTRLHDSS